MKSKEELNALKEEVETVRRKLRELTEEGLEQITGGNPDDPLSPSPSTSPLPCEFSFYANLTVCPHTDAERQGYNCVSCRLRQGD